ncbi:MAG TPA: AMP-binding protein [Clostridiaceae bacterium]|nr:AMP-binding protein [Clostridiaceae bacterium]
MMRIVHGLPQIEFATPFEDLREMLDVSIEKYPGVPAYVFHEREDGTGSTVTKDYSQLKDDINSFAAGLISQGKVKIDGTGKEHIAVIGANSYPWVIVHNATLFGLGISVPLDKQLADHEVARLCQRGKVTVFAFDYAHLDTALMVKEENPQVHTFILLDRKDKFDEVKKELPELRSLEDLIASGQPRQDLKHEFMSLPIDNKRMAAIYFTSGTTSQSKGVMLSQHNIASNVKQAVRTIPLEVGKRALSVLPLHHTFEGTVGMYCFWATGISVCINENLRTLTKNMKEWEIAIILTVPLMLITMHRQIIKNIEQKGKIKTFEFGLKLTRFLGKFGIDVRRKVFKDIHAALGGKLDLAVSGAAALPAEQQQFFTDIGITCLAGYGLTETSPILSACTPTLNVMGSVGLPLAGVTLAIDSDGSADSEESAGEILAKGENVMLGYYENEEATREVFTEDGWFKTGDIGYFDELDCLHITGRAKSVIVLSNGKNVFPEEVELFFNQIPGVKNVMIWGEATERGAIDLSARFQIDKEALPDSVNTEDEEISKWLRDKVEAINREMTEYKKVKHFVWDESDPIMTTTLKIKRNEELQRLHNELVKQNLSVRDASGKRLLLG